MITEHDLKEAIAECQGERSPNANTCIKLAAFLTIQREMFPTHSNPEVYNGGYSFAEGNSDKIIDYNGESEFSKTINGKNQDSVLAVIDELMDAVFVLNSRLYYGVLRKLRNEEGGA